MYTKRLNLQKTRNHYQNKVNKCPSPYIETNYKKNILLVIRPIKIFSLNFNFFSYSAIYCFYHVVFYIPCAYLTYS